MWRQSGAPNESAGLRGLLRAIRSPRAIPYVPLALARPSRSITVPSAWSGLELILADVIQRFNVGQARCLEFGVEFGYSTVALSSYFHEVIGVDLFTGDMHTTHQGDHYASTSEALALFANISLVRSDYRDWIEQDLSQYDLVHVDIVHTYSDTYRCGLWSAQHAKCVLFHDTESFRAVKRAVHDIALDTGKTFYNYKPHNGLGILV
jgi:hypothetical protein